MDHLSAPVTLPPIIQVYQSSIPIQQTLSNHEMVPDSVDLQNLTIVSQSQSGLQQIQNHGPQILQNDGPIQITSHVIVPQGSFFKQPLLGNVPHPYYRQYNPHSKELVEAVSAEVKNKEKDKTEANNINTQINTKSDKLEQKRVRQRIPDPSQWKNNIRKERCQRGEAYINRRGKFVPEKSIRNTKDCLTSCRHKCMEKINEDDRKLLFKAFYSLDANEKKHFLLNTTERHLSKNRDKPVNGKRNYSFKYFFLVRATRYVVCKNFYLGTLAISQKPVYDVHLNKSDANIPKKDGRGLSSCHPLPNEAKDKIRKHIMSFKTVDSKAIKPFSTKRQYLDGNLNVKQMHAMYVNECDKNGEEPLKESMYRKIFKREFNLRFKRDKTCCKCKAVVKDES